MLQGRERRLVIGAREREVRDVAATLDVVGDMMADVQREALPADLTEYAHVRDRDPGLIPDRYPGHIDFPIALPSFPWRGRLDVQKAGGSEWDGEASGPADRPGGKGAYNIMQGFEPRPRGLDPGGLEIIDHLLDDLMRAIGCRSERPLVLVGRGHDARLMGRTGRNVVVAVAAVCARQQDPWVGQDRVDSGGGADVKRQVHGWHRRSSVQQPVFAPTADVLARETPAVLGFGAELLHREAIGIKITEDREFEVIAVSDTRDVATRIC